ncbi:hypothetical protein O9H85_02470 [Paenibacillus filicis]|uniref:Uncharacterized protein n=1 Tax=Paenibacillus gyeongsangnamensis TaxID=3388067 RepID=A0ABT4Q3A0_9BACL|nr:hypothetical protein [Paenibacillus filicis]MCZ8511319.1 hypothetical protein [Paenibacillus filicis]
MPKTWKSSKAQQSKNAVRVKQSAQARTGQGGNAFAINASDVGVVRTDVVPKK